MKNISAHIVFLSFASFFGLLYLIITPPFQVPDEINHFFRAYQISEGKFVSTKENKRIGGYIPQSLDSFANSYRIFTLNPYSKLNYSYIRETATIPLRPGKKVFKDIQTAMYSPVSYAPQSLVIYLLRQFQCKPFYLLYAARLASLIFWIVLVFFSLRNLPFQKWLFVFLALLPMSLSINSSLSADVVTNGLSFFLVAYILKITFNKRNFKLKDFIVISFITILLGFAKLLYVSLLFLFLVIPVSKFVTLKKYLLVFSLILILGFGAATIGKKGIDHVYISYNQYNTEYRDDVNLESSADIVKQMNFIKGHPIGTSTVFLHSFFISEFKYFVNGYIGLLGWGDTSLPEWFVIINYLIIFLLAVFVQDDKNGFHIRQRLIFLFVALAAIILVELSQYLYWSDVGGNEVYVLQGRYFIPVFPLLFLILCNDRFFVPFNNLKYVFILTCFILGLYSIVFLHQRFYYNYNLTKQWEITQHAEDYSNPRDHFLIRGKDTVIKWDSHPLSAEKSHSGKYSIKLSRQDPYGFTYRLYNVKKGDKIDISVWRLGKYGSIIFSQGNDNRIFFGTSKLFEKEKSGWRHLKAEIFVPCTLPGKATTIFIMNVGKESGYFDDFKITYFKKN